MTWLSQHAPTTVYRIEDGVRIEKGIPLPPRTFWRKGAGGGAMVMYPWAEMEVGDSFQALPEHSREAVRSAACTVGGRMGRDFSMRHTPDGVVRVWRTK